MFHDQEKARENHHNNKITSTVTRITAR